MQVLSGGPLRSAALCSLAILLLQLHPVLLKDTHRGVGVEAEGNTDLKKRDAGRTDPNVKYEHETFIDALINKAKENQKKKMVLARSWNL